MATKTKKRTSKPRAKATVAPVVETKPETVLVLRTVCADMHSRGKSAGVEWDFIWPESGPVECPDWRDDQECGHGLHGWLWGHGDYSLKQRGDGILWLIVEVEKSTIVDLKGKVKFPRANVLSHHKNWWDAMAFIRSKMPAEKKVNFTAGDYGHASATGNYGHASATGDSGHASTTGYYGHASATGDSGHASATGNYGHASTTGYYGHASATGNSGHASTTGYYGHASATGDSGHASATGNYGHASATGNYGRASTTGDSGHASATGDYGHASATGYYGHASATGNYGHASATGDYGRASATGDYGWVASGYSGTGMAAAGGVISILWWDEKSKRPRLAIGYVGEDGIKPNVKYRVENGKLVEVK